MGSRQISYTGSAPGADSSTYTLWDSTDGSVGVIGSIPGCRYRLSLKNSHAGTLKAYAKSSRDGSWVQFYQSLVRAPAASVRMQEIAIPIATHRDVKVEWVNGGSAQSTWYVAQALLAFDELDVERNVELAQLVRGPVSSATDNFGVAVTTTHAVYAVPAAWSGRRLRCRSVNSTTWLLFGTSSGVEAAGQAVVSGTPPAWTGLATISEPIPDGTSLDVYVDPAWTHFSVEGSAAGFFYAFLSDYDLTDLPD